MLLPEKLVGPEGEWEQDPCRSCRAGSRQGRQNSHVGFSSALGLTGRRGEKLWDRSGFLLLLGAYVEEWACQKDGTLWLLSLWASGTCFHKAASTIFSSVLTTTLKSVLTTTLLQDTLLGTYAQKNQSCPPPSFSERIKGTKPDLGGGPHWTFIPLV